jgi:hypothetical protein
MGASEKCLAMRTCTYGIDTTIVLKVRKLAIFLWGERRYRRASSRSFEHSRRPESHDEATRIHPTPQSTDCHFRLRVVAALLHSAFCASRSSSRAISLEESLTRTQNKTKRRGQETPCSLIGLLLPEEFLHGLRRSRDPEIGPTWPHSFHVVSDSAGGDQELWD